MILCHQSLLVVMLPLIGAIIAGLFGKVIGRETTHRVTISLMGIALLFSCLIAKEVLFDGMKLNQVIYQWADLSVFSGLHFDIGFLIDPLTAVMMVTVCFVSLLVHVYSIGYMHDDDGYQRFFSYISLFTFMMLMLVTSNNFLQLFFGWEGVGLVSYLLIGFWFKRESAVQGNFKAFLVNRVGDFGFLLGIAMVLALTQSLDYATVFQALPQLTGQTIELFSGVNVSVFTLIALLLFIGAMGKSAQVPLHVWLPESMEGPTPISALIHAATMVTAGVCMVARMSPIFEQSPVALSTVMVIGASGALFLGLLAVVQNDIKRVVAYSTLSQLGYMVAGLGASAYAASIFHLVTHAAFKALLFLGAGSIIVAMHHEQDIRKMGGLSRYLPITYITFLLGTLSLSAIPPFAGFYSKDVIIEAVSESHLPGAAYAAFCVTFGAFVTAFYSFRVFFLTFHTNPRMDEHTREHLHEPAWTVWLPLVILAVPSVMLGAALIGPMLFHGKTWLFTSLTVLPAHDVLKVMAHEFTGWFGMMLHSVHTPSFWLASAGILCAWLSYIVFPVVPALAKEKLPWLYNVLLHKYGFDEFNQFILVRGTRSLGSVLYSFIDRWLIDGMFVNQLGMQVKMVASRLRTLQTGFIYHSVIGMIMGLFILMGWSVWYLLHH